MVDGAGASFVVEGKKNPGIGNVVERRRQQKPWNTLRERNKIEAGFTGGVFFSQDCVGSFLRIVSDGVLKCLMLRLIH